MDIGDGVELLSKLSGLSEDKMMAAEDIVKLLSGTPLALTSAGHYMQSKATKNPNYSSSDFLNEVKHELQKAKVELEVDPSHVVVAMEIKNLVQESSHLLHAFDFLGTCTPDWPIPVTLVALHLRSPDFNLPPVIGSGPALPSQQPSEAKQDDSTREEVEEMFLSVKKLAKNLESFMTAVRDNVDAIKAMLNPEMPDLPQMSDGVVEMLKACPLVSVVKMDPMGKVINKPTCIFAAVNVFALGLVTDFCQRYGGTLEGIELKNMRGSKCQSTDLVPPTDLGVKNCSDHAYKAEF